MIQSDAIHVYWYDLDSEINSVASDIAVLEETDLNRLRAIETPELAEHFTIRRILLRCLLAHHCAVPPSELRLETGENGKPRLAGRHAETHFNTSYSKSTGVIAVSKKGPLGVDLELQRPIDLQKFSERILSPAERLEFATIASHDRQKWMFRFWTAKEAVIKAVGGALSLSSLPHISHTNAIALGEWQPTKLSGPMQNAGQLYVWTNTLAAPFRQPAILSIASSQKLPVQVQPALGVLQDIRPAR